MTQTTTLPDLLDRLAELARSDRRQLVALVGPPGAGKSHVSDALAAGLAERVPGRAAILTMDGYHLDDGLLAARGDLARKGAPHTFDLDGFAVMLDRLAADDGRPVLVPVFDRALEISRAGARQIDAAARLIVVEGNYLLLDRPGWRDLSRNFRADGLSAGPPSHPARPPAGPLEGPAARGGADQGRGERPAEHAACLRRKPSGRSAPGERLKAGHRQRAAPAGDGPSPRVSAISARFRA